MGGIKQARKESFKFEERERKEPRRSDTDWDLMQKGDKEHRNLDQLLASTGNQLCRVC